MSEAKSISELVERLRLPDCVDANCVKCRAADALESQAAEMARLREAIKSYVDPITYEDILARAALADRQRPCTDAG